MTHTTHFNKLMPLMCLLAIGCSDPEPAQDQSNTPDQAADMKDMSTDMVVDMVKDSSVDQTSGDMTDMKPDQDTNCGEIDTSDIDDSRPAKVYLPTDYDGCSSVPLVILLHGYSANAQLQDRYFRLSRNRNKLGYILITPDGTKDANNNQFWNASKACCDFAKTGVDDVGYIRGLIEKAQARYNIDPRRIYLFGHSNGGFMSYRMACEASDLIAGIVSLAGAALTEPANCSPAQPVSILQVHGTLDETIFYNGGTNIGTMYPSAKQSVERWAMRNGCDAEPTEGQTRTLISGVGDETTTLQWNNCKEGGQVSLWTIVNGSHIPAVTSEFSIQALEHVFKSPKPAPSE